MKTSTLLKTISAIVALQASLVCPSALAQTTTTNGITGITVTSSVHQYLADRPGTVTLTVKVAYKGTVGHLGVRLVAPATTNAKWSYQSANGATALPAPGDVSPWEFSFTTTPTSPATFTVTLNYAKDLADPLDGVVSTEVFTAYALQDNQVATDAHGAPIQTTLTLTEAVFHTADTNQDMRLSLDELLRVVQIYNTRNANVRTGAYDASYAPDPSVATPVVPATPHSADTDGDGAINLMELMRVIDLCKYSPSITVGRTGEYHADSTGVDGFAPGP
jgi:hypothetical protein